MTRPAQAAQILHSSGSRSTLELAHPGSFLASPAVKRFSALILMLFVALSACDFVFTYLLVEGSGGAVYEANPVASSWLADHGWLGLAAFKAFAVLVVIGAVALIVQKKPAIGAAVACVACLATGFVNLHSHRMLTAAEFHHPDEPVPFSAMMISGE
jgi:hypothetical protein